jgi:hypothetical protein
MSTVAPSAKVALERRQLRARADPFGIMMALHVTEDTEVVMVSSSIAELQQPLHSLRRHFGHSPLCRTN